MTSIQLVVQRQTNSHEIDLTNAVWVRYLHVNGKITDEESLGMRRRATPCVTNKMRKYRVWHVGV